eukprot:gene11015-23011_t
MNRQLRFTQSLARLTFQGKTHCQIRTKATLVSIPDKTTYAIPTFAGTTPKGEARDFLKNDLICGDHMGRQQNHIWSKNEVEERLNNLYRYEPVTYSDHAMNRLMYTMYHTFNFITGYKHSNPSVKSIEWRLIALESVAGVPGFLAAGFRHFRSLRSLQRDNGWIATLLEEAENERMHLLVCMKMANASIVTRLMVVGLQLALTPFLGILYAVHPRSVHRFVGYLEETACHTYKSIIEHIETPGTNLHNGWHGVPAPTLAISYWRLPKDAQWVDALKCIFADEANHRDVNHTFATMDQDDPNPFVAKHRADALKAFRLAEKGERYRAYLSEAHKNRDKVLHILGWQNIFDAI